MTTISIKSVACKVCGLHFLPWAWHEARQKGYCSAACLKAAAQP